MAVGIKQGRFQFQYGTSKEWERSDLILLRGEAAFEADTTKLKFGDGRSLYKDLPYVSVGNLKVTDFTEEQQKMIQGPPGPKGDPMTYDALTVEQRLDLKGDKGDKGDSIKVKTTSQDAEDNTVITFSDGSAVTVKRGEKGEPFTYDDFTEEQLEALRGPQGEKLRFSDLTEDDKAELKEELDLSEYIKKTEIDSYIQKVALEEEPKEGVWANGGQYYSLRGFTKIPNDYLKNASDSSRDKDAYKVLMTNTISEVGDYAFSHNNISELKLSQNISKIGSRAFEYNKLKKLVLNDNLEEIGSYAFTFNDLESIEFNDNLKQIRPSAFVNNKNLKEVTINKNTQYHSSSFPSATKIVVRDE